MSKAVAWGAAKFLGRIISLISRIHHQPWEEKLCLRGVETMPASTRLHGAADLLHSLGDSRLAQRRMVSTASCTAVGGRARLCRFFQRAGTHTDRVWIEDRLHMLRDDWWPPLMQRTVARREGLLRSTRLAAIDMQFDRMKLERRTLCDKVEPSAMMIDLCYLR